jgi:deoxyribose-phosphate aldolase
MIHVNRFIENTILRPDLTEPDIENIIQESITYRFAGICVPPFWVEKARLLIAKNDLRLITTAGFPFGYNLASSKLDEISSALDAGADEIDMVWNLSAFKSGKKIPGNEIEKCSALVHKFNRILKVIIETCYLDDQEIIKACGICSDAGADFVKTSTGYGTGGARVEHVRLMRSHLPSHVGIKAAGGIRDYITAVSLVNAGADRIGTSSGSKIMKESPETK